MIFLCTFRVDQSSPPQTGLSPPYAPHNHLLGKYEDDFPLRKTGTLRLNVLILFNTAS